jgi:hypothetical protein
MEVPITLSPPAFPSAFPSAFPITSPIPRQIRVSDWQMGEQYLQSHPNISEIEVHTSRGMYGYEWIYKVVRIHDVYVRQTWCNGKLVAAYIFRQTRLCPTA